MALSRRIAKATDTFDSSITSDWENGGGDWDTCTWVTGGYIRETTAADNPGAVRRQANPSSFGANQYSKAVIQTLTNSGSFGYVGAAVRMASGANESTYLGVVWVDSAGGGSKYKIEEFTSAFGFTSLTSGGGAPPTSLSAGDYIVMEASGSSLELYTKEGAGSETSRLTTTDATISGGSPGIVFYHNNTATSAQATSWEGGDDISEGMLLNVQLGGVFREPTFGKRVRYEPRRIGVFFKALVEKIRRIFVI